MLETVQFRRLLLGKIMQDGEIALDLRFIHKEFQLRFALFAIRANTSEETLCCCVSTPQLHPLSWTHKNLP